MKSRVSVVLTYMIPKEQSAPWWTPGLCQNGARAQCFPYHLSYMQVGVATSPPGPWVREGAYKAQLIC